MLIEEVDHRRNHRKIEKKEESDSGVLFVSSPALGGGRERTLLRLSLNHFWKGRHDPSAPHRALVPQYSITVLG
jgi:hypothetical protein